MAGRLEGKVAVVTGGAAGIGLAIAQRYAAEGALVCIADIAGAEARIQAEKIGGKAFSIAYDGGQLESIRGMVQQVVQRAGGIDILVNNAAVVEIGPFLEIEEASYDRVFNVNVKGLLFTLQAAARAMIEKGKGRKNHQPGLPGWETRGSIGDGVWRQQSGRHQHHAVSGSGPHSSSHQRQWHSSRGGRHTHVGPCRQPVRQVPGASHRRKEKEGGRRRSLRPYGGPGRSRGRRRLSRLAGQRLCRGADPGRRWR